MHRISRAPVLSATRSRVSGWITWTAPAPLPEAAAPGAGEGPRPYYAHEVALVRVVALVVYVDRARGADDLLVDLMAARHVDAHRDRFVGLRRGDDAGADLGAPGPVLARSRDLGGRRCDAGLGALRLLL